MDKPRNYDDVKAFGEFEPLELGGHICRIMKVEERLSKSGKEMIVIYLDIAEGRQRDYFKNLYENDQREKKKWGCVVYQLVHDKKGDANRGFKTFNTAVEESNEGFKIIWGNGYSESLRGKLIGGVFGREQYKKQNEELAWTIKCFNFRSVKTIKAGVSIPEDKLYKEDSEGISNTNNTGNQNAGFYSVEDTTDDDLPF